jgi:hypothetical protein
VEGLPRKSKSAAKLASIARLTSFQYPSKEFFDLIRSGELRSGPPSEHSAFRIFCHDFPLAISEGDRIFGFFVIGP